VSDRVRSKSEPPQTTSIPITNKNRWKKQTFLRPGKRLKPEYPNEFNPARPMNKSKQSLLAFLRITFKIVPILFGLIGLALVIAWISGLFVEKIPPGEASPVAQQLADQPTDIVHEIEKDYIEESVGTLKAASRSVISSKILATIQEIHVSAGDFVKPGDLLITLDTRELDSRLEQAGENLTAASAAAREAELDFERNQRLHESNAISQREYEESNRKLQVAKANERRAEQSVDEAKVLLSYSTIVSPKAGRIVDRTAEPGDTAQPGAPILTLYDSQSLRLETPVLEHLAVKLKVGQKLNVHVDSIDQDFSATIDEIVPQADAASRSFLVKASIQRSENLYEGMYGRLQIPAGSRRHLCLATDAIVRIGQLEFVDVVLNDKTLQRRLIKTGRLGMPGRIEVLSGLEAGETVVLHAGADPISQDTRPDVPPSRGEKS
jgi:RND family efflux transporter MFP subunit